MHILACIYILTQVGLETAGGKPFLPWSGKRLPVLLAASIVNGIPILNGCKLYPLLVDRCIPRVYTVPMIEKNQAKQYFTVAELAKILGITRAGVHKKIKAGKISTIRIGRTHAIPATSFPEIIGTELGEERQQEIAAVVKRVVKEYGETLKLLGKE